MTIFLICLGVVLLHYRRCALFRSGRVTFQGWENYLSGVPVLTFGEFIVSVLQERGDSREEEKWEKERYDAVCYVMTNWKQHRHAGTMK